MSRKTRKLIRSAPLMAVLAVAGALTLYVVLIAQRDDGAERGDGSCRMARV